MLEKGLKGITEYVVAEDKTAKAYGSGELEVYATPAMIALMEETAYKSVAPELEEGMGTVGTLVNVKHLAATPIGMKITCHSELLEVDGRRLVFHVEAYDEKGLVGEGTHERFIIQSDKFQSKANSKLS